MVNKPIPGNLKRVILVNPTRYLGNLLLAGGLMQAWAAHCREQGIALKLVIDDSFQQLCENVFPTDSVIWYPRRAIGTAGVFRKILLYANCLKAMRGFNADLAFNIEEDAATSHLTRLSGAAFKLGCSAARHTRGYDHVLPVQFEHRPAGREHRWYSYYEVFAALGMPEPRKSYLTLKLKAQSESLAKTLQSAGWRPDIPTIALHAGATKDYKKWPLEHMAALAEKLFLAGLQPVLLGAGDNDSEVNAQIKARVAAGNGQVRLPDLCNRLSLVELARFLKHCAVMVGNDSGPFHLGSAVGVPGLVLWGPTNKAIWGPLGAGSEIVQGSIACDPACNKGYCLHNHRCLREISPESVLTKISARMAEAAGKVSN